MALSLLAKLRAKYFQQFIKAWGREPQNPREWMSIQDAAVREINKTKGVPGGPKKPPFQGWDPKVIQGGKGIESLLKSGDVKIGQAPKTTKETLKAKKDRGILLRDSEEGIARIKSKNKQAIEDFKKKFHKKKTVEDLRDEGDWDPYGMASGGRIGMAGGGAVVKFIEGLFIKASNDIRQGKGKWKGLTQDQWIKQHDNLTKMIKKWEWGGKKRLPPGAEEYIGMNDLQVARAVKQAERKVKTTVPEVSGIDDLLKSDFEKAAGGVDERTALKQKYPGLTDDLLDKILIDDNPQRKAEVLATMDEFLKLREVGKSGDEAFDIISKSFSKTPTKHAEGGRASLMYGGDPGFAFEYGGSWADWQDKHRDQMPVEQYIKTKLPKDRLPFREPMILADLQG